MHVVFLQKPTTEFVNGGMDGRYESAIVAGVGRLTDTCLLTIRKLIEQSSARLSYRILQARTAMSS
jgi:hypothetical protein